MPWVRTQEIDVQIAVAWLFVDAYVPFQPTVADEGPPDVGNVFGHRDYRLQLAQILPSGRSNLFFDRPPPAVPRLDHSQREGDAKTSELIISKQPFATILSDRLRDSCLVVFLGLRG